VTADPLGYVDPLGFLPPVSAPPPPTPTPTPVPRPVPKAKPVHVRAHARGDGVVMEQAPVETPAVAAPVEPAHVAEPKPTPQPQPKPEPVPVAHVSRPVAPDLRRPVIEPVLGRLPLVVAPLVHAIETEPLVLSVAPGIVAALLALLAAFTRCRRPAAAPARVIPFGRDPPLRRAA
jgi:hypothetical protein